MTKDVSLGTSFIQICLNGFLVVQLLTAPSKQIFKCLSKIPALTILTEKKLFTQFITKFIEIQVLLLLTLSIERSSVCKRRFIKWTENKWLLLSASFTAKFELVFVLTQENAFSQRLNFKANRRSIDSYKKRYYEFTQQTSV